MILVRRATFLVFPMALAMVGSVRPAKTGEAPTYTFVRLAQSETENVSIGYPVLNNQGQAATYLTTTRELGNGRVRTLTTIVRTDGVRRRVIARRVFPNGIGDLSINDRGDVAFPASLGNYEEILRGRGGGLTRVASTRRNPFEFFTFGLQVNTQGQVAFGADLDNGDEGLFVGKGRAITTVYRASQGLINGNPKPAINDRGQVAFAAWYGKGSEAVFRWQDGAFTQIAEYPGASGGLGVSGEVALNENGEVAFVALLDSAPDNEVLFAGDEKGLRRVADDTGPLDTFEPPAINDSGQVAFLAGLDPDGEALSESIFVATGEVLTPVIRTGDPLDGSTVVDLVFAGREAFNNGGQVAFGAYLADGRFAVYRADPKPD